MSVQVLAESLKGNLVKFGDGPAAVIGDERRVLVNSVLLFVIIIDQLTPLEIVIAIVVCFS